MAEICLCIYMTKTVSTQVASSTLVYGKNTGKLHKQICLNKCSFTNRWTIDGSQCTIEEPCEPMSHMSHHPITCVHDPLF